jgi:holo-[acyl-carrier protein] synthase
MVIGIGTDILKISNIEHFIQNTDDPFIKKTYTKKELELIQSRTNPSASFATRFAGKEAVFKSLSISGNDFRNWCDIEILENKIGQPQVILHDRAARIAVEKNITSILISLSYDSAYAIAYATALTDT